MTDLPSGDVTFCFTDIEGSTQLFARLGPAFLDVLEDHRRIIRAAVAAHGGHEVKTEGDGFFLAFADPMMAVAAATSFQQALHAYTWPRGAEIAVRVGLHVGEAMPVENDYAAFAVHEAARVGASAHGGQTIISDALRARLDALPHGVSLRDLGVHELKDIGPVRLHQLCHEGARQEFPPPRAAAGPRGYLPATTSTLVGRDDDIADLSEHVAKSRLVTITGSGGVGKTRLAIEVGRRQLGRHNDGVWFVDLASTTDAAWIDDATLQALGVVRDGTMSPRDQLLAYLQARDVMLVIDNCEHLLEACVAMVSLLLTRCAKVRVLATSRESLGLDGEVTWRAGSLDRDASLRLFLERASVVRPDRVGSDDSGEDEAAIVRIVERLDGIPLAIELAAARMRVLTAAQIAERLHDRFSLLTGGRKTALPRQRTLEATVDWSYALLDDDERRLLRSASVFVGGFDLAAADAVWQGDVLDVLDRLVDKSMIVAHLMGDAIRYRTLETIRQYGWMKLVDAGEAPATRGKHARYFADLLDELTPGLLDERETTHARLLEAEHENIRAALDWAASTEDWSLALDLASNVWLPWAIQGNAHEGLEWLARVLPHAEGDPERIALANTGAAHLAWITQRPRVEMSEFANAAVAHARQRSDGTRTWYDAWAISMVALSDNHFAADAPIYAEAIEWARAASDPFVQVQAFLRYAEVALNNAKFEDVDRYFDELLRVSRQGPASAQCYALQSVARRTAERGHLDDAVTYALDALAAARRGPNVYFVCFALHSLGFAKSLRGDADAVDFLHEAIDIARHAGLGYAEAESELELAWVLMSRGDPEGARAAAEHVIEVLAPLIPGNPSMLIFAGLARQGIAETLQMDGRFDEARRMFEENLALMPSVAGPDAPVVAVLHNSLGLLGVDADDLDEAESWFTRSLSLCANAEPRTQRALHSIGAAIRGLAAIAYQRKDARAAASLCGATAEVHEIYLSSRLGWIRYHELLAELQRELGDDFAAAWQAGEQLGLDATAAELLAAAPVT